MLTIMPMVGKSEHTSQTATIAEEADRIEFDFRPIKIVCLFAPIADDQIAWNLLNFEAAYGQKRPVEDVN